MTNEYIIQTQMHDGTKKRHDRRRPKPKEKVENREAVVIHSLVHSFSSWPTPCQAKIRYIYRVRVCVCAFNIRRVCRQQGQARRGTLIRVHQAGGTAAVAAVEEPLRRSLGEGQTPLRRSQEVAGTAAGVEERQASVRVQVQEPQQGRKGRRIRRR